MAKGYEVARLKKELLLAKETIADLKQQNEEIEKNSLRMEDVPLILKRN